MAEQQSVGVPEIVQADEYGNEFPVLDFKLQTQAIERSSSQRLH